jgi:hypothetical protein
MFGAKLRRAKLNGADLRGAKLLDADHRGADLSHTEHRGTCLASANLTDAIAIEANLEDATLAQVIAVRTNFIRANLTGCHIYGISAWDLNVKEAIQKNLELTHLEPRIQVDDIEVAQFIYLLLNRRKLRDVIITLGEKAVLILGRFTERKRLLDGIAEKLRVLGYLPIIFDFDRPTDRDLTETVKVLAGLSLFVIADITNPQSVPLELQATVPDYEIPFVTILQRGQPEFGMFRDLPGKYHWALPLLKYNTEETLLASFEKKVVAPALEKVHEVRRRKAMLPADRSAED